MAPFPGFSPPSKAVSCEPKQYRKELVDRLRTATKENCSMKMSLEWLKRWGGWSKREGQVEKQQRRAEMDTVRPLLFQRVTADLSHWCLGAVSRKWRLQAQKLFSGPVFPPCPPWGKVTQAELWHDPAHPTHPLASPPCTPPRGADHPFRLGNGDPAIPISLLGSPSWSLFASNCTWSPFRLIFP